MHPIELMLSDRPKSKLAIFSHERSGTHFLMNTLAYNFGYCNRPWWNFDYELGLNFHAPEALSQYFSATQGKSVLNILKSHHPIDFFEPFMKDFSEEFTIFYIYRDPRDVMLSYWKWLNGLGWEEGPKCTSFSDFIRHAPTGGMMRYQKKQCNNVLQRWAQHVHGWISFAKNHPDQNIFLIRYEDLHLHFESTVDTISHFLQQPTKKIHRPHHLVNVVGKGTGKTGAYKDFLTEKDLAFFEAEIGSVIQQFFPANSPAFVSP